MIIYIHKGTLCINSKVKVATTHNSSREVQKGLSRNNMDILMCCGEYGSPPIIKREIIFTERSLSLHEGKAHGFTS